jgi:phosphatidylglycerophosphatase C
MVEVPMTSEISLLDAQALIEKLEGRAHDARAPALAFDADGTLWTGDVGEEVFARFLTERLLKAEAGEALSAMASSHGLSTAGDANALGEVLMRAHASGALRDLPAFEMMTWAYAGRSESELYELALDTLRRTGHEKRGHGEVRALVDWAKRHGIPMVIVSASPRFAVQAGTDLLGIDADHIVAGKARVVAGRVSPAMESALPYGPTKVIRARDALPNATWLAAFGDSDYDLDLLLSAEVGVLVRPKVALVRAAQKEPSLVRLLTPRATADLRDDEQPRKNHFRP